MKFNTYKGYPLVRNGNQLYYGYMSDPYVIFIQILETKEENGEKMTSKVRVVQMDTNEPNPMKAFVGLLPVKPFADVVTGYTCCDRNNE